MQILAEVVSGGQGRIVNVDIGTVATVTLWGVQYAAGGEGSWSHRVAVVGGLANFEASVAYGGGQSRPGGPGDVQVYDAKGALARQFALAGRPAETHVDVPLGRAWIRVDVDTACIVYSGVASPVSVWNVAPAAQNGRERSPPCPGGTRTVSRCLPGRRGR